MAYWMPSSVQKRLLRYALSRTGLLDDSAIDLADLDITLGRQNVVKLSNVGLNIEQIGKLAQLPPELRIETARVLSLKLTVPADIFTSSIVAEADGVEVSVRLVEDTKRRKRHRPEVAKQWEQRRARHRTHSPPSQGTAARRRSSTPGGDGRMPTTQDLARSFLLEEPLQERRQLEASIAAREPVLDESVASGSTDSSEVGTGAGVGLPGFLAGFLLGIVDRLQLKVRNVQAKLELDLSAEEPVPLTVRLTIGDAEVETAQVDDTGYRTLRLNELALDILTDATIISALSEASISQSPKTSRSSTCSTTLNQMQSLDGSSAERPATASTTKSRRSSSDTRSVEEVQASPNNMQASIATADSDRFADAGDEDQAMVRSRDSSPDTDILLGEDNESFAARRSQGSAPSDNLWNSVAGEEDLPDSLVFEQGRVQAQNTASSSQQGSSPHRSLRAVSPYARNMKSPGSWPRLSHSPSRKQPKQSLGSWPTVDQTQHSMMQPLTPGPALDREDPMDNKRTALEHVNDSSTAESFEDAAESGDSMEDMARSTYFDHEQAKSMYMSAMTQGHSQTMAVPGGWSSYDSPSERSLSPEISRQPDIRKDSPSPHSEDSASIAAQEQVLAQPSSPPDENLTASGVDTPRAASPKLEQSRSLPRPLEKRLSKQLVHLDHLSVQIPASVTASAERPDTPPDKQPATASTRGDIPGAFSVYSERTGTRRGDANSASSDHGSILVADQYSSTATEHPIRVRLGNVDGHLDLSLSKIIHGLLLQLFTLLNKEEQGTDNSTGQVSTSAATPLIDFAIDHLGVHLCHEVCASVQPGGLNDSRDHIISLRCTNTFFSTTAKYAKMGVGQLALHVGGQTMLSFSRDHSMHSSVAIQPNTPDIECKMSSSTFAATNRPSRRIQLGVLPIVVDIDIPVLQDVFASFGGLSGLLELGNSMILEGTTTSAPSKPSKGVRFAEDDTQRSEGPELKVEGRIEGAAITMKTNACAVVLYTAAIKFVHRPEKTGIVTSLIRLEGPHTRDKHAVTSKVDVENLKLEYVSSAQESDLERLLSLLTPRKDKYDNDDDIMIDTLLRQRRKGAVARLTLDKARINVADLNSLSLMQDFATEMGQISAVAKYLPEDERPGLMTILRVNETHGQVPINDRFGNLVIRAGTLTAAHVGLPPLFALAVSGMRAEGANGNPLVHPVIPLNGAEDSPMVMARMLGNEAEPTVKIKLFNICLEYSVRTLLDLTDTDEQLDAEEIAAGLAKSVAALATRAPTSGGLEPECSSLPDTPSDTSSSTSKRTRANLLLHDCAIGLTPSNLPSKALLVLTDAQASTLIPPESILTTQLELRRSALLLTDDTSSANHSPSAPSNTSVTPRLLLALWKQGYASVGSITSAKLEARILAGQNDGEKSIELDFTNKLLFLETCADSTQTLIATLNGLAPPPKPSKQPKYLTEPMSIEEMMASFTGEPVDKPERVASTLFDVDDEVDPADMLEANLDLGSDQDDDLLIESEFTNSLYGPVSGMLTGVDAPVDEDRTATEFQGETADSLLEEEDPFEMPGSPGDMQLSDHQLMRDLDGQSKPFVDDQPIDLDLLEYVDVAGQALGHGQTALGTNYRFAPPGIGGYQPIEASEQDILPFKLRLRDCHVIWHIHDGYDWQRTQDGITEAVEQIEMRAEEKKNRRRESRNDPEDEEDVIGDCLFNSIYIGVPSATGAQDLRRQINRHIDEGMSMTETESVPASGMTAGGRPMRHRKQRRLKLGRSPRHKAAFELKGVAADIVVFNPDSGEVQSSVDVRLRDFEIFDNVPTSTWRKFLTCAQDKNAREMSKPMVHLQLSNVKTLQEFSATEIVLRVTILPLRLHVDQDALDFITRFFEFKDESMVPPANTDQPFLQRVEIDTVDLCLDYKPKKVDYAGIRSGHTTEFMNFIILEGCRIRLNHAIIYGIQGFEPLHKTLNDIWMPDVKANQLPKILSGLAPVRNLANLGAGMRDVVAIPVREYRKDGRIVRSIQKGAFHFAKTTTTEMARMGAKVALGTQNLLSNAEDFLSTSASSSTTHRGMGDEKQEAHEQRAISAYADQPLGVLSGLRYARRHLEHDLLTTRDALIAVQGEVFESSNPTSAAAAVVRHGPTVILRPIIGASRAVGTAMTGLGNQIDPANVAKMEDKYKPRR